MSSKALSKIKSFFQYLGLAVLIFVIIYGFINAPAIIAQLNYYIGGNFGNTKNTVEIAENGTMPKVAGRRILPNNHLYIPKLNIDAQISWNVTPAEENNKLKSSVVHLSQTAYPGTAGNVFITGHSSYYWWLGKYTNIFALLGNLNSGDKIAIVYADKIYTYKVTSKFVVRPNQIEVLKQGQSKELTLMTCVPIGTNLNRLIVKTQQIGVSNR